MYRNSENCKSLVDNLIKTCIKIMMHEFKHIDEYVQRLLAGIFQEDPIV